MWFFNLDAAQLLWMLLLAIPVHVVWMLLSRRFHPLFILATVFLLLSPFSTATSAASIIVALKWARVYCIALMIIVGIALLFGRRIPIGKASVMFLIAFSFYIGGSFWSEYPFVALAYKGSALMLLLAGMLMGATIQDTSDLQRGLRFLMIGIVGWTITAAIGIASGSARMDGRLDAYGMNPNVIAMVSAFSAILALTSALYDRSWLLKAVGYGCCVVLAIATALTGSRAGFGAFALGVAIVLAPLVRRPIVLLGFAAIVSITVFCIWDVVSGSEAASRLLDTTTNTREGVWRVVGEQFSQTPFLGAGWLSIQSSVTAGRIWFHTHNMYLQVLVDVGAVGLFLFLLAVLVLVGRWVSLWWIQNAGRGDLRWAVYFGLAMALAPLGLGMFESAPISNASPVALFFGFSVGFADRLRQLATRESVGVLPLAETQGIPAAVYG